MFVFGTRHRGAGAFVNKKIGMGESRFAEIEQTQEALRVSIEKSKALAEESEQLIAKHRKPSESPLPVQPTD